MTNGRSPTGSVASRCFPASLPLISFLLPSFLPLGEFRMDQAALPVIGVRTSGRERTGFAEDCYCSYSRVWTAMDIGCYHNYGNGHATVSPFRCFEKTPFRKFLQLAVTIFRDKCIQVTRKPPRHNPLRERYLCFIGSNWKLFSGFRKSSNQCKAICDFN